MKTRGFTLVEVLVVAAIVAVVAAAIGACLAAGIRAWEEARRFGAVENQAVMGLEIMEKDVMNAAPFFAVPFRGDGGQVSFPRLVREGNAERIGTVKYYVDAKGSALCRKAWAFPAPEKPEIPGERIVGSVEALLLEYYEPATENGANGEWAGEWDSPTNFPAGVRVSLVLKDGRNRPRMERTMLLPVSVRSDSGAGSAP